jgi:hypothetical protein
MKNQNITIVLLMVTTALLTGILVSTFVGTSQTTSASGNTVSGSDYMMCTATYSLALNIDNLWVIDKVAKKMNVYWYNNPAGRPASIDLGRAGGVDLEAAFPKRP